MKLVRLTSNHQTFRTVQFREGLNLVAAHRTDTSVDTDSRNGSGKTTLLQILDFCLGGSIRPGDSLAKMEGGDWEFTLELLFPGELNLTLTRAVDAPSEILIAGDVENLGLAEAAPASIGPRAWTNALGDLCFGLGPNMVKGDYAPTFRRLIGHFLRFRADAYITPFESFAKQPPHQVQADNAFLLGLDWRLAVEWQKWKDRGKSLGSLGKADQEEVAERLGELESQRVRLSAQHRRLSQELRDFDVLPEYREVERRANAATAAMQTLVNESTVAARTIEYYEEALMTEVDDSVADVESVFAEAGLVFSREIKRSLAEVREFHAKITSNRRDYLAAEVRRLREAQKQREEQLQRVSEARRRELQLLESKGALEDFANLQQRLGAMSASLEAMSKEIEQLRELRKGKAALRLAQIDLQERTSRDVEERMSNIASILENFADLFDGLYGEAGTLAIDVGDAGYRFRAHLPKEGSHGIGKMGVFAYDLAVAIAWSQAQSGPGLLAHDSIVFDGVDERQTAGAVAVAATRAMEGGFQYLLTMNSDDISIAEFERVGVDLKEVTIMTLTDHDAAGGLLGVRI